MKIVKPTAFGGPEVLEVLDVDVPSPGPGQVLVQVRAIDVNPVDYKMYSGAFGSDPSRLETIGTAVSGVLAGADDAVVADAVVGTSYAEQVVADASAVLPKPESLGFEEAAALLAAGRTAYHALDAVGLGEDVDGSGTTVLIHGASGGVGSVAVQLAALRGASVVATGSEANHDYLRSLGALPVTYGPGLTDRVRALAPSGVDAALDLVGTDEALAVSLELVADHDRLASIASGPRGRDLGFKVLGHGPGADPGTALRAAAGPVLLDLAGAGRLRVEVSRTYPLDETAAAHAALRDGHTRGKVVVVP